MITVLRIGHRLDRDKRITTHVCLVARALGADEIIITTKDARMEETIGKVVESFGGPFSIKSGLDTRKVIKAHKEKGGIIVHLTMYGELLDDAIPGIIEAVKPDGAAAQGKAGGASKSAAKSKDGLLGKRALKAPSKNRKGRGLMVIVGAEKVPRDIYDCADFNVAVGNQPHSEVAALALFLDRYHKGAQFALKMSGGRVRILPNKRGKTVVPAKE